MKNHAFITVLAALILLLGSVGTAQAEIIPSHGEGQIGLPAVVLCETLTLRQQPSASSKAVKTLRYGDRIIVQPETGGWAACFLTDSVDGGRAGWVNENYLAIDPAWYRTEGKTPVHAWNDPDAPRVALLDENTTLPILKAEGAWLLVSLRGAAGWIYTPEARETGRRDGERFEAVILLEGMEESVRYEHIVSAALGIEMDYDWENFERRSEGDRECFVSRYDDPVNSEDYLELRFRAGNADAVAAEIGAALSQTYDIVQQTLDLDRAGQCVCIHASAVKGQNITAERMQTVYIIPAAGGCIVATAHCTAESSEGFGVRAGYMINTLALLDRAGE